jgi:hypothetical protein
MQESVEVEEAIQHNKNHIYVVPESALQETIQNVSFFFEFSSPVVEETTDRPRNWRTSWPTLSMKLPKFWHRG